MKQRPLFDLEESRKARDKGLKEVEDNSEKWLDRARAEVYRSLPPWPLLTALDLRLYLEEIEHVGRPHHPNAWGALVRTLVGEGFLIPEHRTEQSVRVASHARALPVYRQTNERRKA